MSGALSGDVKCLVRVDPRQEVALYLHCSFGAESIIVSGEIFLSSACLHFIKFVKELTRLMKNEICSVN